MEDNKIKLMVKVDSMKYQPLKREEVISNFSFTINKNEIVTILGPSGAGKTTLLRIIAGLEKRFKGSIILNELEINKPSRKIQLVFQDNRLLPWFNVRKNLEFVFPSTKDSEKRVKEILSIINLKDKEEQLPMNLSGGEESRVAFARALMDPPEVLLLDEPFRNLDLKVKYSIIKDLAKMLKMQHTISTIIVSHNVEEAVLLSNKIIVVGKEPMSIKKIFEIKTKEFPRNFNDEEVKKLVSTVNEYIVSH